MARKKIICIYLITNPVGHLYVGQTVDFFIRCNIYKNQKGKGQTRIQNSIKKYGWEAHKIDVLLECDIESLDYFESYYIRLYNTFNTEHGMNLQDGGNKYRKSSYETRKKQSESAKGKNTWTKGRKHSEESKKQISESNKGKVITQEARDKVSKANSGKKRTREQIERMAKGHLGIEPWNKGLKGAYKHSEETLQKMRDKNIGKKMSEEARKKISEKAQKRWSDPIEREKAAEKTREFNRKKKELQKD